MSIQDTIRRIQEEAKRKVDVARYSKSKPQIAAPVNPFTNTPTADEVVESLREQLSTAIAQALSTKAARQYIGNITEELQNIASVALTEARNVDFGGAVRTNDQIVIYPKNCKLLVQGDDGYGSMIIEEQPQFRTVLYRQTTHYIALPYMVYLIGFQYKGGQYLHTGTGIAFGKEPIDSIGSRMYHPTFPHTKGNLHVCQPMQKMIHKTVKELGEYVIQTFWNTSFHYSFYDYGCSFTINEKKIRSFEDWEKIKNPLDILQANFPKGHTVQEILQILGHVKETRVASATSNKIQSSISRVVNGINSSLSADELSAVILNTAQEIVNVALQNAVGDSALQH